MANYTNEKQIIQNKLGKQIIIDNNTKTPQISLLT